MLNGLHFSLAKPLSATIYHSLAALYLNEMRECTVVFFISQ